MIARIHFVYRDTSGKKTWRKVDIEEIEGEYGDFLLTGHCHIRDAERTFSLSSMSNEIVNDETGNVLNLSYLKRAKNPVQLEQLLLGNKVEELVVKRKPKSTNFPKQNLNDFVGKPKPHKGYTIAINLLFLMFLCGYIYSCVQS